MAKAAVIYRLDTMELDGVIKVSQDDDLELNLGDPAVYGHIEVSPDHPVRAEQHAWKVTNGELVRKSDEEIAAFEQTQRQRRESTGRSMMDVLLEEINALRIASGKPALTMIQIRERMQQAPGGPL